ncbi:thioredoxin family protein [Blastopirellula sp. JC732]|uniref:Thioredoxin family protein n=1 Tax=Blastopirellula sediminis TaxID=2894196 RepID=A0A9X1MIN4_9BACT|nr:thioredoxin family protein [Blastopirellula sediminis]MCC9604425.1 thioredoxin family protein [Blastopirellula sediminis]MCC9626945.1 thioredoxin family protein [Blastopirellula sediminis]
MPKPVVLLLALGTFLLPIGVVVVMNADKIQLPEPPKPHEIQGKVYFFSAPWCGACKRAQPTYEQLRDEGYPIKKINVDNDQDLAMKYNIRSIPTFVYVRDGKEVGRTSSPGSVKMLFPWW